MTSRLGSLRLYKFDVPYDSNVGVLLVTQEGGDTGYRFRLTRYTGRPQRDSKSGLSQSFVDLLGRFFFMDKKDSNITNQILTYLVSNFSFNDLEVVPPACPVLVFHFHVRELHHKDPAPQIDIKEAVMDVLRIEDTILDVDDVGDDRFVPIAPTTTEIVDCYRGQELCCLCGKGYPKEEEIVYKTVCNHIFHATCISSHLLRTPQCPVCSADLLPVDIRTLLF
ncbi:hypothetical protein EUTSA_v10005670mg [Eutrema salsugineum]|uniref:RING-type domain-containing protein n=1 Tax=Eutrema salsugineum TaxID=72664 RepID=V4KQK4_EUTSA|nr:hypothetical protein EUTSA_v10005670mg [Eutrema salsugineum]